MIAEYVVEYITEFIGWGGYVAVFVLMALESMIAPVPSEAVMPFTGFLIHEGRMTWLFVVLASTAGSIIGSLISYCLGAYGGKAVVNRYGKYLLLDLEDLEFTEKFFSKHGNITIFVSRFIPVIRHLISIPAGVGRMNLVKFIVYTAAGAAVWNTFLAYVGYYLRSRWDEVLKYSQLLDVVVVFGIICATAFFIHKHRRRRK